jgi:hypothetical protein
LSLWSYPNLYTDKGCKSGKGTGKELCDLLVVFGPDVIIFSVKFIEFNPSIDIQISWKRWFKRAVLSSARQLYGAESWLRRHTDRIFLDPHCNTRLPISLPDKDLIRIHRIAVALGIHDACKDFFGGRSLGSLMVDSFLSGDSHLDAPFHIGHVNPDKGYVHVLDDFTLNAILRELDTIADFVAYLTKKEQLLSRAKPKIIAAGEEQLLSLYLTRVNESGEHDFVFPDNTENMDVIHCDEGFWENMVDNPQYIAKKQADRKSYIWDQLIEQFIKYGKGYDFNTKNEIPITEQEPALRLMASEPRLRRRYLAEKLLDRMKNCPKERGATSLGYSSDFPNVAYLFLILPPMEGQPYEDYRKLRMAMLMDYCKVAKLLVKDAVHIMGIATEPLGSEATSEDFIVLDTSKWTHEMQQEAETLQKKFSLFLEDNISRSEGHTKEYPDE